MGRHTRSRTAPRVRDGRVAKKNNWRPDPRNAGALSQEAVEVYRDPPGAGYRHLLTIAQLRGFLDLLPDWEEVAVGLDRVVLGPGDGETLGWHYPGMIIVSAWEHAVWWHDTAPAFVADNRDLLDLLGVHRERNGRCVRIEWTQSQARAFQLLDVLPHELGHHHDRMTTRSQTRAARGEPYAERYALEVREAVWPTYVTRFGI